MKQRIFSSIFLGVLACWGALSVIAEDRYLYFTWEITNGTIYPLGFPQQVGYFFICSCKRVDEYDIYLVLLPGHSYQWSISGPYN